MLPPDRFAPPPLMPPTSGSADGRGGKLRFIAEYGLGWSPTLHHARKIANSLPSRSPKLGHSTQLHPFNNLTGLCPSCLISKWVVILDFEGQRMLQDTADIEPTVDQLRITLAPL